jgi:hypothetical protein
MPTLQSNPFNLRTLFNLISVEATIAVVITMFRHPRQLSNPIHRLASPNAPTLTGEVPLKMKITLILAAAEIKLRKRWTMMSKASVFRLFLDANLMPFPNPRL